MTAVAPTSTSPALEEVTASYIAAASSSASAKGRRLAAQRFGRLFGDLDGWNHASVEQRPTSFTMCRDGIAVVVVTR